MKTIQLNLTKIYFYILLLTPVILFSIFGMVYDRKSKIYNKLVEDQTFEVRRKLSSRDIPKMMEFPLKKDSKFDYDFSKTILYDPGTNLVIHTKLKPSIFITNGIWHVKFKKQPL